MQILFSKKLYTLFRDISIQNNHVPISIFEPPQRYSRYDPTLNFWNSVSYPVPDTPESWSFCMCARRCKTIDSQCMACDLKATNRCIEDGKLQKYRCHLGFWDCLIPVRIHGIPRACIFIGQVSMEPLTDENFAKLYATMKGMDPYAFTDDRRAEYERVYYENLCHLPEEKLDALCSMMMFLSDYLPGSGLISECKENLKQTIITYLCEHISDPISATRVCEDLHISRSTLYRVIQDEFGLSFNSYVNHYKMLKACALLKNQYSVKETAMALGYDDVSYFSRLFKRQYGIAPTYYR